MRVINIYKLTMAFLLLLISGVVMADCGYSNNNPPANGSVSFGTVYVQRDSAVGTVLATGTTRLTNGGPNYFGCFEPWNISYQLGLFTTLSSLGDKIYNTNIDGVGIRITDLKRNRVVPDLWDAPANGFLGATDFKLELFKTVENGVAAGDLTQGTLFSVIVNTTTTSNEINSNIAGIVLNSTSIVPVACSITTQSLTFPIGDISASLFGNTVGTIPTGGQNSQGLGLNCDANANINVMLQGTQNPDVSTNSVLSLTGQGNSDVAKGVGVQLLYNGTPLELNNRIVLKQSTGGQETFPITAQYYQTKSNVSVGKANASATLDLTYQ